MNRFHPMLIVAAIACAAAAGDAQSRSDVTTVALSDPDRPGRLDVSLTAGVIEVTASDRRDIVIDASSPVGRAARVRQRGRKVVVGRGAPPPRADTTGLTRVPQPTALDVEESNNVVRVRGRTGTRVDLRIQVPVRTSFKLEKTAVGSALGTITVRGLDGDIEVHTGAGDITLVDVSGSVVAHSTGGSVIATLKRVTPERPMAFTSYSGNVDVTLPRSTRADVILRSSLRDVFTDFELQQQQSAASDSRQTGNGLRRSSDEGIRARVNGGGPEFELRTYAGSVYLRRGN
jgi:hypothetical protein